MSYILDALKKSDQERQQENPLHLEPLYATAPSARGEILPRNRWPWFLLLGLLALGGLVNFWGWNQWGGGKRTAAEADPPPQAVPAQAVPAPAESAAPATAVENLSDARSAAGEGAGSAGPIGVQTDWYEDWRRQLPQKDVRISPERGGAEEIVRKDPQPPVTIEAGVVKIAKPVRIKREREKVLMAPQEERTVSRQTDPEPPVIRPLQPAPAAAGLPQSAPAAVDVPQAAVPVVMGPIMPAPSTQNPPQAAPPGRPKIEVPYLQELPAQVQAEIPKLQFAGHAYAHDPAQRLIVINGMIMREGDQIDGATRLAEITWEGVIIDRKGVRFQVKCY